MTHPGFTMNAHQGQARIEKLRERRENIEATIKQLQDALYIIDSEIVEGEQK